MTYINVDQRKLGYKGMGGPAEERALYLQQAQALERQANVVMSEDGTGSPQYKALMAEASRFYAMAAGPTAAAPAPDNSVSWFDGLKSTLGFSQAVARASNPVPGWNGPTIYVPEIGRYIPVRSAPPPGTPLAEPDLSEGEYAKVQAMIDAGQQVSDIARQAVGYYKAYYKRGRTVMGEPGKKSGDLMSKISSIFGSKKKGGGVEGAASAVLGAANKFVGLTPDQAIAKEREDERLRNQLSGKDDEGLGVGSILLGLGGIAAVGGLIYFATKKKKRPLGRNN